MKRKEVVEIIRGIIPKWIERLKLQNWDISINYMTGNGVTDADGFRTHANCSTNWEHKNALICFWPKSLRAETVEYIEYVVVHELLHAVVNEMRETGIKHEERVVVHLAKAIMGMVSA